MIYKNTGNGKKQGPSTTLKANVLQNFFCCLSCVSNNIIIIAISVASSSLNNPVHKLLKEDGHGKTPCSWNSSITDIVLSIERQKYGFCVFRFNMVVSIYLLLTNEKWITKDFLFMKKSDKKKSYFYALFKEVPTCLCLA